MKLAPTGLFLFLATGFVPVVARQIDTIAIPDNVCGPRCISHVESLFGMRSADQEFIELVRDVQGLDVVQGSSLSALSGRLTSRGLYTVPIKLNWFQELHVPNSATILHVLRDDGEGHFLVREQFGNSIRFWDGLNGYSDKLYPQYRLSGYCLVVSKTPTLGRCTRPGFKFWTCSFLVLGSGFYLVIKQVFSER